MVWSAMFLSSCVPPDNEAELNDISIFSVRPQSLFPPQTNKQINKPSSTDAPYSSWSHKGSSRTGDKVEVVKVLGISWLRFPASPM